MKAQDVYDFVKAALECSVYLCPTDPGLAHAELFEVGKRLGFQEGEIGDALQRGAAAQVYLGDARLRPTTISSSFTLNEDPEYRVVAAFDFVVTQLNDLARSHGLNQARLDRSVIVARAVANQLQERAVQAAITILIMDSRLAEKEGVISFAPGGERYPLASEQVRQMRAVPSGQHATKKEARARAYPVVKDVIERRTDGRAKAVESLDAFGDALEKLGYGPFRLWWTQTVAELRQSSANLTPVSVSVLSAALVEGALTFVVKHARSQNLGVLGSKDFDRDPRTWKIDDLVSSAAAGKDSAILDAHSRGRADELIRVRQRIHAGRMLSEFPGGAPDVRAEEARESQRTAELVVRRILDWLEKYPPGGAPSRGPGP